MANCCDPKAPKVNMIKLDNGMVGVLGLEQVMAGVHLMEPLSKEDAMTELVKRAALNNYIPGSVKEKYAEALYGEYVKKFNRDEKAKIS